MDGAAGDDPGGGRRSLYATTLAKGLRILRAFDEGHRSLSLAEVVARTGLERSAAQRLANTLQVEGMLDRDPLTRRFRPSIAWLEMAYAYYWSDELAGAAMPRLIELRDAVGETVNLARLAGEDIVYTLRLPAPRAGFAGTIPGRRLAALATTSGRAILGSWPPAERNHAAGRWRTHPYTPQTECDRARLRRAVAVAAADGFAVARGQLVLGELAVAAPVRGANGRAEAAVQVSVSAHAWDERRLRREILPGLLDAANALAR